MHSFVFHLFSLVLSYCKFQNILIFNQRFIVSHFILIVTPFCIPFILVIVLQQKLVFKNKQIRTKYQG